MNTHRSTTRITLCFAVCFAWAFFSYPTWATEPAESEKVPAAESAAETPDEAQKADEADFEDIERLLKAIDVGPYRVPDLTLKKDHNYARSAVEVEPFRHVTPYKEHFLEQMEYTGPGRAIPEPDHVDSVKIGFIGPIMGTVSVATGGKSHEESLGIPMLRGAQLAIEHANERGGYTDRGIPFELVVSNDNGLWGASGNEIVKLAYRDRVWAILGTIDGANSHIAIRVALKAEIVMMNSGDTDPTFIETNIPWVFRCIGDDRQMGYLLVDYVYRKRGFTRVGIIRSSNRYGRFGVREIRDGSRRLTHPIIMEMAYQVGAEDFSLQLERLKESDVEAIVHWGDAEDGAYILNQMREMGMDQPYFACDRCASDEFIEIAGRNAEGVICGYPWNPQSGDPDSEAFQEAYEERYGIAPSTYAAHAYDGMSMLIWAIQTAGLNRAKIRDVLAHREKPFKGATGEIPLSACLDDLGEVFLARCEGGEWKYYAREDWDIPQGTIAPRDRVSRKTATD
jgi:branched-chain amino acid transport system substrate-binding protein